MLLKIFEASAVPQERQIAEGGGGSRHGNERWTVPFQLGPSQGESVCSLQALVGSLRALTEPDPKASPCYHPGVVAVTTQPYLALTQQQTTDSTSGAVRACGRIAGRQQAVENNPPSSFNK